MERETVRLRWALLAGAGLVIGGLFVDAVWHSLNPGRESAGDMLRAHFVIYVGVAAAGVTAIFALARRAAPTTAFAAALVGAAIAAAGHALDVYAHSTGTDSGFGHALVLVGEAAVVVTAVILSPVPLGIRRR